MIVRRPVSASRERRTRRDPERVDRLASVVARQLVLRRGRQEEVGVEALGHERRGDPVRERHEALAREEEVVALHSAAKSAPAARRAANSSLAPRARASSTPHSSNVSRIAATRSARASSSNASDSSQRARSCGPASPGSTLPPGNTSAPVAKSIWWWRSTMKTSSPPGRSRRSSTVAASRGPGAGSPKATARRRRSSRMPSASAASKSWHARQRPAASRHAASPSASAVPQPGNAAARSTPRAVHDFAIVFRTSVLRAESQTFGHALCGSSVETLGQSVQRLAPSASSACSAGTPRGACSGTRPGPSAPRSGTQRRPCSSRTE